MADVTTNEIPAPPVPLTDREEVFLSAFTQVMITVARAFEEDLIRGRGVSLNEYYALMHLSEAPGRRLRMRDLACVCWRPFDGVQFICAELTETIQQSCRAVVTKPLRGRFA